MSGGIRKAVLRCGNKTDEEIIKLYDCPLSQEEIELAKKTYNTFDGLECLVAKKIIYACDLCGREISAFDDEPFCNGCIAWVYETRQKVFALSEDIVKVDFKSGGDEVVVIDVLFTAHAQAEKINDVAEKMIQSLYGTPTPFSISELRIVFHQESLIDIKFNFEGLKESDSPELDSKEVTE